MDNGGSLVESYTVRYEDQSGSPFIVVDNIAPGDMWETKELLVSNLAEGELYTFYVQAVNVFGTSGASPPLTVVAAIPAGIVCCRGLEMRPVGACPSQCLCPSF